MSSGWHGWNYDEFEEQRLAEAAQPSRRFPLRLVTVLLVGLALIGVCI